MATKYRVQGPDGTVHVFEGPDDATPTQIEAFAAQTFGAAPKPAAAPATRGKAGMFDILSAPFEMGATLATKPRKEQVEFIAPAVEALGSAGGAFVGCGGAPTPTQRRLIGFQQRHDPPTPDRARLHLPRGPRRLHLADQFGRGG